MRARAAAMTRGGWRGGGGGEHHEHRAHRDRERARHQQCRTANTRDTCRWIGGHVFCCCRAAPAREYALRHAAARLLKQSSVSCGAFAAVRRAAVNERRTQSSTHPRAHLPVCPAVVNRVRSPAVRTRRRGRVVRSRSCGVGCPPPSPRRCFSVPSRPSVGLVVVAGRSLPAGRLLAASSTSAARRG